MSGSPTLTLVFAPLRPQCDQWDQLGSSANYIPGRKNVTEREKRFLSWDRYGV